MEPMSIEARSGLAFAGLRSQPIERPALGCTQLHGLPTSQLAQLGCVSKSFDAGAACAQEGPIVADLTRAAATLAASVLAGTAVFSQRQRRRHRRGTASAVARKVTATVAAPPTSSATATPKSWANFAEWITARGGDVSGVAFCPDGDGVAARGLVALRDIAEGESIIEIPIGASVELADAKSEKDPSVAATKLLTLYNGEPHESGDLRPYFDLLPTASSLELASMPDFFDEKELRMLQCPEVATKTQRRQQLCAQRASENGVSVEEMTWALCTVAQRCFTVVSPFDGLLRLLLPGIDFFNHDADARHHLKVKWTLHGLTDGLFKVVAGSQIKAGEEICICYGGNPYRPDGCGGDCEGDVAWTNKQYIQRYGFVDKSLGTTMVDGKWLVTDDAAEVRSALEQSSLEDDEALLADVSLSTPARVALDFRCHLKRALAAQRAGDAALAQAKAAKAESAAATQEAATAA